MFTGIVSAIGQITRVQPLLENEEAGLRLRIEAPDFDLQRCKLGDSIAIQGACMTVVELEPQAFSIDISKESLNRTVGLDQVGPVNLEAAMRLGDTLDGHMVLGHVDGVGTVSKMEPVGESYELRITVPQGLAKYLAYKGSVTVNGVANLMLTVQAQNEEENVLKIVDEIGHKNGIHYIKIISKE